MPLRIAGAVGMRVVAEGIETGPQQELLVDASCHYGQGFLYSTPLPFDEAAALLEHGWPDTAAPAQLARAAAGTGAADGVPDAAHRRPTAGVS